MSISIELEKAAFEGALKKVEELLDDGAEIDAVGQHWNPLHAAIENEQISIVEYLLRRGADIEAIHCGMTPLQHAVDISVDGAIQSGGQPGDERTDVIKLLLENGAQRESAIALAHEYKSQRIIQFLEAEIE